MQDFAGKVAVITGAAEGIGRALAQRAHAAGMRLVLADIDGARLEATAAVLRAGGADLSTHVLDVADPSAVEGMAQAAYDRCGDVHLLVNNAGVAVAKSAWDTTLDDWRWVLGINLFGVIHGVRSFVPRMLARKQVGHVVNVASIAGLISPPSMAAYDVSKHGVVALSESLHHDLRLHGAEIGVSVLCPAWVRTRIAESERNRHPAARTTITDQEPFAARAGAAVAKAVDAGIAPEAVAEAVFEAVARGRFYILTHPETHALVRTRLEDILEDRVPTPPAMGFGRSRDDA